jgi:heme exporter protein C
VATVILGLLITPPDQVQSDSVRFLYLHVPAAATTYLAFLVTALCSIAYLVKRTRSLAWDRVAGASAEIGLVFTGLMLVTGAMWGRLTWSVYWRWDARLTSTALLFVMFLAYLAVRKLDGTPEQRAKRSAIVGIIAFLDVPIVHKSVDWWQTLHQDRTFKPEDSQLDGLMLFTFFVGLVAQLLIYAWLLMHRHRLAQMEQADDDHGLATALTERRSEGSQR